MPVSVPKTAQHFQDRTAGQRVDYALSEVQSVLARLERLVEMLASREMRRLSLVTLKAAWNGTGTDYTVTWMPSGFGVPNGLKAEVHFYRDGTLVDVLSDIDFADGPDGVQHTVSGGDAGDD